MFVFIKEKQDMFTCCIRYVLDSDKIDEFEEYARTWIELIEKYGGVHHGYFLPEKDSDQLPEPTFSFPGIGRNGPDDIAVALFSFTDLPAYELYKREVAKDEKCKAITTHFNNTKCFLSYERNFLKPILPNRLKEHKRCKE